MVIGLINRFCVADNAGSIALHAVGATGECDDFVDGKPVFYFGAEFLYDRFRVADSPLPSSRAAPSICGAAAATAHVKFSGKL